MEGSMRSGDPGRKKTQVDPGNSESVLQVTYLEFDRDLYDTYYYNTSMYNTP